MKLSTHFTKKLNVIEHFNLFVVILIYFRIWLHAYLHQHRPLITVSYWGVFWKFHVIYSVLDGRWYCFSLAYISQYPLARDCTFCTSHVFINQSQGRKIEKWSQILVRRTMMSLQVIIFDYFIYKLTLSVLQFFRLQLFLFVHQWQ